MKKRLSFLYRYFTKSRHFRLWRARSITTRWLLMTGLMVVLLGSLALSEPIANRPTTPAAPRPPANQASARIGAALSGLSGQSDEATPDVQSTGEPVVMDAAPTRTPLPPEYLTNSNQTTGITLASVLLVVIVLLGVLLFFPRRDEA